MPWEPDPDCGIATKDGVVVFNPLQQTVDEPAEDCEPDVITTDPLGVTDESP